MHIDGIQSKLQELNAAAPRTAKPKTRKPAPKVQASPVTAEVVKAVIESEDVLRYISARIVAALQLDKSGVTPDSLVAAVHNFEQQCTGTVQ